MKITVWIRPDDNGQPSIRTDYKYESKDTPRIQNFGIRLLNAIEGCTKEEEK